MNRRLLLFFTVPLLSICFTARADVDNGFDFTVYLKPEYSSSLIPLVPGAIYKGRQDAIFVPNSQNSKLYKTVDHINVTIYRDGRIATYGGNFVEWIGQTLVGGWMTPKKSVSWMMRIRHLYKLSLSLNG